MNVIVQYNSAPTLLNLTQLLSLGGTINAQYSIIPAISVTLPAAVVDLLALEPAVAYISPNRALESTVDTLDINTASADADLAYQSGYTGAGVGIAIIDSGIYSHPDLAGAHRLSPELRFDGQRGRLRSRNARGGHRGGVAAHPPPDRSSPRASAASHRELT